MTQSKRFFIKELQLLLLLMQLVLQLRARLCLSPRRM
jgi:hypothetical protein